MHVVDRRRLGIDQVGEDRQPALFRPLGGGEQNCRGAIGKWGGVAGGHGGRAIFAEHWLEPGKRLHAGLRAHSLVFLQTKVWRDKVIEKATLPGRGEIAMAGHGELVLLLACDTPLTRRDGGVLTHRHAGARLSVSRSFGDDLGGAQLAKERESLRHAPRPIHLKQYATQLLVDRDGRVAGSVDAGGDAILDLAERDLVRDVDGGFQPGAAGLLDVIGRRPGREARTEDGLAGEVEVATMLEHRASRDLAEASVL